jgi:hypothetical protein
MIELNKCPLLNEHVRRSYHCPDLTIVRLDNEISLALQSTPPFMPNEALLSDPVLGDAPISMLDF